MSLLFDSTLKITAIVLAALVATVAMRRQSAALRHWVLSVAIMCAVAAPLLGLIAPWHVPVFTSGAIALPAAVERTRTVSTTTVFEPVGASLVRGPAHADTASAITRAWRSLRWPRLLGAVWIAGVGVNLLILGVGLTRLVRITSRARRIESGRWFAPSREIGHAVGLRRSVEILQTDEPALLVTWGFARPKVLLPATAQDWPDDRIQVVLHHEFAHISRGDWAVQMVAETLRALYWFNPFVWITCRVLRQESEHACDDAVISGCVGGPDYATHLLDLARALAVKPRAWLPAPAMARPSSLEGRIRAMLNASINRRPLTASWRAAIAVVLLGIAVPIAGAQAAFFTFSGVLVDQTNRVIPAATMVLTSAERQAKYEIASDGAGHFAFVGLPSGDYAIEVREIGFATLKDTVRIASRSVDKTLQLQVGSLEESVTVSNRSQPSAGMSGDDILAATQRADERNQKALAACAAAQSPVGGTILPPTPLVHVNPVYPDSLKDQKIGGVVIMEALIGADGTIEDVSVLRTPDPDLSSAAVDAVRQWTFSSTLLNCTPIQVKMTVTMNFIAQ
jgi:TonB family protein